MNLQPTNKRFGRLILLSSLLLLVSLACNAARRLVLGPEKTEPTPQLTATPCVGEGCLDACLDRVHEILETERLEPVQNEYYQEDTNMNIMFYTVDGDQLGKPTNLWVPDAYLVYQADTAAHQRIWKFFQGVIPLELRSMVTRMMIFTDGYDNTLAWVNLSSGNNEDWTVAFDILDSADPLYLTSTLVHEVGHLVTLNATQSPPYDITGSPGAMPIICNVYLTLNGCPTETSYIELFYERFWTDIWDEWNKIPQDEDCEECEQQWHEFCEKYSSEFFSEYAASHIQEDLAESWEAFILRPKPAGDQVADQKVLFFYDFPELVTARQQIIEGLCQYAQE